MSAPLLAFESVTFGYRRAKPAVFRDVSFGLHPGGITAIVGPNGVGKTTLLYVALGWLAAWSGAVTLDERSLRGYTHGELGRTMALIPQSEHTPFDYTVLEYVLLGRAPIFRRWQCRRMATMRLRCKRWTK